MLSFKSPDTCMCVSLSLYIFVCVLLAKCILWRTREYFKVNLENTNDKRKTNALRFSLMHSAWHYLVLFGKNKHQNFSYSRWEIKKLLGELRINSLQFTERIRLLIEWSVLGQHKFAFRVRDGGQVKRGCCSVLLN